MAIVYIVRGEGQCQMFGLSTDAKPAAASSSGQSFLEVDTGHSFLCDGATWVDTTATGAAAWGAITGTLANQTDLQTALNGKATSAQGALADTALQNAAAFATAAQGTKADTALQANPNVGTATGTSLTATGAIKSSGTAGIGYAAGAGGAVTQATSKVTGVTLNKLCGAITMHNAALAAAAEVTFTVTNSTVGLRDVPVACVQSVGTAGAYFVTVGAVADGSFAITVGNCSAGSLSQALVLNFIVFKAVNA